MTDVDIDRPSLGVKKPRHTLLFSIAPNVKEAALSGRRSGGDGKSIRKVQS